MRSTSRFLTRIRTWFQGTYVGQDCQGRRFYVSRFSNNTWGRPKRWVVYTQAPDPTSLTSAWHGWLHYMWDDIPSESLGLQGGQKPCKINPCSQFSPGKGKEGEQKTFQRYTPWTPLRVKK